MLRIPPRIPEKNTVSVEYIEHAITSDLATIQPSITAKVHIRVCVALIKFSVDPVNHGAGMAFTEILPTCPAWQNKPLPDLVFLPDSFNVRERDRHRGKIVIGFHGI